MLDALFEVGDSDQ